MTRTTLMVVLFLMWSGLWADQRYYLWTYQYSSLPRGEAEIESYTTYLYPEKGDLGQQAFTRHQVEIEVGMSNRLDVGVYQTFFQNPGEGLTYSGFKLRFRYRMGTRGRSWVDPLLYLELKSNPAFSEQGVESKLILAHDWGRVNISLNPVAEWEWKSREFILKYQWVSAVSVQLHPLVRLGMELKIDEDSRYAGPVISHGNERFWVAVGGLSALRSTTNPQTQFRMIIGLGL